MWGTKTDLDRILGRYVGLGFEVNIRRDSGWLRVECHTSDQMLRFLFSPNGDIHGDIEKTLENTPKNEPTAAEIIDARLRALEVDTAQFDERIAESIKRLSESGQITSSSGNALNVKGASDPNDDEVLTDDNGDPIVVGSGFVSAWNSGSFEPVDERPSPKSSGKEYTNAEIEKYGTKIEVGAGDFPEAELDGFRFFYTGSGGWYWCNEDSSKGPAEEIPTKKDKQAAKAEFFGDRVEFVSTGGRIGDKDHVQSALLAGSSATNDIDITDETLERMLQEIRALSPEDAMARLMGHKRPPNERSWHPEELPHTLPPHIVELIESAKMYEGDINTGEAQYHYRIAFACDVGREVLKHFGGES